MAGRRLFMPLHEDGAQQADGRLAIGEDADDPLARRTSSLSRSILSIPFDILRRRVRGRAGCFVSALGRLACRAAIHTADFPAHIGHHSAAWRLWRPSVPIRRQARVW